MADENKIYFDENGKAFTRSNSDTQNNQEIQEQDFKTRDDYLQALATKAWEDYASKVDLKPTWEGEGSDEFANKVKRPFQFSNYLSHKVAEPIYKGVDVVAKRLGDKIGDVVSKIKGYSASDRVKALMKQYDEMNEDNIDFGDNANREGYDKAGEYFGAKDKYEKDYQTYRNALDDPNAWYYSANGYDTLEEPQDPNSQFASLTGTGSYKNWKPESKVGKIAKGASGITGDMLPEMLEGWGGEVAMGALAPAYVKMKEKYLRSKNPDVDSLSAARAGAEYEGEKLYRTIGKQQAEITKQKAKLNADLRKNLEQIKSQLTPEEYQALLRDEVEGVSLNNVLRGEAEELEKVRRAVGDRVGSDIVGGLDNASMKSIRRSRENGVNGRELRKLWDKREQTYHDWNNALNAEDKERYGQLLDDINEQIAELRKTNQPKPLPNPAAQRAEALARNSSINVADDFRDFRDYQKELAEHYRIRANVNNDAERRMMNRFSQQALDNIDAINSELGDSRLIQGANEVLNSDKDLARAYSKLSSEEKRNAIKDAFKKLREGTYDGVPDPANPLKSALSEEVYSRIDEYGFPY